MKILLAIIAAASLVVGCGVFEEEQTTADTGASNVSTTTTTDSSGGDSTPTVAPTSPAPVVVSWSGTKQLVADASSSVEGGNSIATDSSGNVYMTGYTGGFGYNTVVKYDSSGVTQWTQQL